MEQNNYLDIIEGMLYLAGDDGVAVWMALRYGKPRQ